MNCGNVHFEVALEGGSVAAVGTGVGLLPGVGQCVSPQVLGGLKAFATLGAKVSPGGLATQDHPQSTVTQTFTDTTTTTTTHALKNTARS